MRSEGHGSEVVGLPGVRCLWDRNHAGSFPQRWDPLQTQAQVENVQQHLTELVCTVLQESGADAVGACTGSLVFIDDVTADNSSFGEYYLLIGVQLPLVQFLQY